jgi:hypothetical protein
MSVKKKGALRIADEIIAVAHNTDVMILIVFTGFVICSLQSKFEPISSKLVFYTTVGSGRCSPALGLSLI